MPTKWQPGQKVRSWSDQRASWAHQANGVFFGYTHRQPTLADKCNQNPQAAFGECCLGINRNDKDDRSCNTSCFPWS